MQDFPSQLARLKQACNAGSDTALARILECSQGSISNAKAKGRLPTSWIFQISERFSVSADWIYFGRGLMRLGQEESRPAPERNAVSAPPEHDGAAALSASGWCGRWMRSGASAANCVRKTGGCGRKTAACANRRPGWRNARAEETSRSRTREAPGNAERKRYSCGEDAAMSAKASWICRKTSTIRGSNWVPRPRRIISTACSWGKGSL